MRGPSNFEAVPVPSVSPKASGPEDWRQSDVESVRGRPTSNRGSKRGYFCVFDSVCKSVGLYVWTSVCCLSVVAYPCMDYLFVKCLWSPTSY